MLILGVDPGLRVTGYGVISIPKEYPRNQKISLVEAGIIRTKDQAGIADRLSKIHRSLEELVSEVRPNVLVIEKLYAHYDHPATSILMGHARGVVCLLSGTRKIPLVSLASTHVKKAITGKGHATKAQMQRMIQHHLQLSRMPEPADVADALAIAVAYVFSIRKSGNGSSL